MYSLPTSHCPSITRRGRASILPHTPHNENSYQLTSPTFLTSSPPSSITTGHCQRWMQWPPPSTPSSYMSTLLTGSRTQPSTQSPPLTSTNRPWSVDPASTYPHLLPGPQGRPQPKQLVDLAGHPWPLQTAAPPTPSHLHHPQNRHTMAHLTPTFHMDIYHIPRQACTLQQLTTRIIPAEHQTILP